MRISRACLIPLFVVCSASVVDAAWVEQPIPVLPGQLMAVHAVDENVVWTAGSGGAVLRTTDGGESWTAVQQPSTQNIWALWAFDDQTCIVGNSYGQLWRTANAGSSWTYVGMCGSFVNSIHFFNDLDGWAMGDPSGGSWGIRVTGDGGQSWSAPPTMPPGPPLVGQGGCADWIDADVGVFGTVESTMMQTVDGGSNWSPVSTALQMVMDVVLDVSGVGLAATVNGAVNEGQLLRTTDFGVTWEQIPAPGPATSFIWELAWVDGTQTVWAVPFTVEPLASWFYVSENGGVDWVEEAAPTDFVPNRLEFDMVESHRRGWVVGSNGGQTYCRIWRWNEPDGIAEPGLGPDPGDVTAVGLPVLLGAPLPNPTAGHVSYDVHLQRAAHVRVSVFDSQGRMVRTLLDRQLGAGSFQFGWDPDAGEVTLPRGVYFLHLRADDVARTRKIVLVQ